MITPHSTTKEALIQQAKASLALLGKGPISASAYDTAWVARIPSATDPSQPMFPECLQWIIDHQTPDGTWGAKTVTYYHDHIICTLSSLIALKQWNVAPEQIALGEVYLQHNLANLSQDAYATVGFELIFPTLVEDAYAFGLNLPYQHPVIQSIEADRAKKLAKIPLELIYQHPTTILHSLEGLGGMLDCQQILKRQAENGSFLNSPSSTAFVYLHTGDAKCLEYIQMLLAQFGDFVPVNYPIDIFETLWVLNNIYFLGLELYFQEEIRAQLNILKQYWTPKGVPWSKYVQTPDLDDTAVLFKLLRLNGEDVSASVFEQFYDGHSFFCFPGELDTSPSHIVNLLEAAYLRQGEEILLKAETYSRKTLSSAFARHKAGKVGDKWLISDHLYDMVAYVLNKSIYQTAPWLEQQERIALYRKMLQVQWIDKAVYTVPTINSAHFLEIAQQDSWLASQAFELELRELQAWAAQFLTPNHAIRVLPTHFVACNIAPHPYHREIRLMFSKITLWLFGTDDFFDADILNLDNVRLMCDCFLAEDMKQILLFPSLSDQETIRNLWYIIKNLMQQASTAQQRDVRQSLYPLLQENLAGGIEEAEVRHAGTMPSLEQYMNYARLTIGVPLVLELTFYMMGSLPAHVTQSQEYNQIITLSSDIIRLLNDIRSYEKELKEGKMNSVGIIMHQENLSYADAVALLMETAIQPQLEILYALSLKPSLVPTNMKAIAFNLCRTTAWFYRNNDFHQYTANVMMRVYEKSYEERQAIA